MSIHRTFLMASLLLLTGPATLACDASPQELHGDSDSRELEPAEIDPPMDADDDDDDDDDDDRSLQPASRSMDPVDTSESYLDDAARTYLEQAGMTDVGSLGATKWVNACSVSAHQGAGTFNSGKTEFCSWANVLPGWVIIETDYTELENDNDRGSASISTTNGPVTISSDEFGPKFNAAISLAAGAGDVASTKKLELEYQRINSYSFKFDGQGNQLVARVTANGGLWESSRIEIQARARLLRVH